MGKPSAPEQQTVTQRTELPEWVNESAQRMLSETRRLSEGMPGPYSGNLVAPLNNTITGAWDMAREASTMGLPGVYAAQEGSLNAASYNPQSVQAQTIPGMGLGSYMNPMTDQIESNALRSIDQMRQQSLNKVGDSAISANAFGGSRQGVMEGVTNAEAARAAGDMSATLRGQNYDRATALMAQDANRGLQAGSANQQAGLQGAQINNQGALGLANISQMLQSMGLQGSSIQETIGNQMRGYEQQLMAQDAARYEANRNAPFEGINREMAVLGGIPYGQSSSTTGPATMQGANPMLMGLGAAGMASQLFGGTGALSGLTSGLAGTLGASTGATAGGLSSIVGLLAALSDKDEKTNMQKLGKDPETGAPLYAYDYKADVAAARKSGKPLPPKRVGPMAQDLEKMYPGSTGRVGGKLVVRNLGFGG